MLTVREAVLSDAPALAAFTCCAHTAKHGLQDIQRWICENKALRSAAQYREHRYLLLLDGVEIVAVAYHVPWYGFALPTPSTPFLEADLTVESDPVAAGQLIQYQQSSGAQVIGLTPPLDRAVPARFIKFIALADSWQGRTLTFGMKVSHWTIRAVVDDIRAHSDAFIAGGKIDRRNRRCVRLVEEMGWTLEPSPNNPKLWLALTPLYGA